MSRGCRKDVALPSRARQETMKVEVHLPIDAQNLNGADVSSAPFRQFRKLDGRVGPSYPSGVQHRLAATEKTDKVADAGCGSDHENRLLANSFA